MLYSIDDDLNTMIIEHINNEYFEYELSLMKNKYKKYKLKELGQIVCTKSDLVTIKELLSLNKKATLYCGCVCKCSFLLFEPDKFEPGITYITRYILGSYRSMITKRMGNDFEISTGKLIKFFEDCLQEETSEDNS